MWFYPYTTLEINNFCTLKQIITILVQYIDSTVRHYIYIYWS